MKQLLLVLLIASTIGAIGLVGCGNSIDTAAVEAVKRTITKVAPQGRDYETGPLEGGTAVLVDDYAAYWVKDGIVYGANGIALMWSPGVGSAAPTATLDKVKEAVRQ